MFCTLRYVGLSCNLQDGSPAQTPATATSPVPAKSPVPDAPASKSPAPNAEEEIDIDLNDPEVGAAAVKIQASFKGEGQMLYVAKVALKVI